MTWQSCAATMTAMVALAGCPFNPGERNYPCASQLDCVLLGATCVADRCVPNALFITETSSSNANHASSASVAAAASSASLTASSTFLVGGVSIQQQWSNLSRGVIIRCGRVIFWDG